METAIRTRALTKRYGKTEVLAGVDLDVPVGSVYGLLGRNGAGKTTIIRILMDLTRRTGGRVEVLGRDPQRFGVEIKRRIGFVSENPALYRWMKVREAVDYVCGLSGVVDRTDADRWIHRFGLDRSAPIDSLSRGQVAQVGLVCALCHNPDLLILDEPVSGLDAIVRQDFLESIVEVIQQEGRTVLISSHLVHELERVADWIGIIHDGRMIQAGEIDGVKNGVKEIAVRGNPGDIAVPGLDIRPDTDRGVLTVYNFGEDTLDRIRTAGADIVEVTDLPLEQAFIAHVRRSEGGRK